MMFAVLRRLQRALSRAGRACARPLGFSVSSLCLRPEPWAAQKRGAVGALTSGTFRPASPVLLSEQRGHYAASGLTWRFVAGGDNGLRRRQERLLGAAHGAASLGSERPVPGPSAKGCAPCSRHSFPTTASESCARKPPTPPRGVAMCTDPGQIPEPWPALRKAYGVAWASVSPSVTWNGSRVCITG